MKTLTALTALLVFSGTMAMAAITTDDVISDFTAQGYTRVEVKSGPTQIKVEAIRGTQKVETVYEIATGKVLSHEVEQVEADDDTRPGIEVSTRARDFVGNRSSDDDEDMNDDNSDDNDANDDDDRDDSDHHGGHDDDDDDGDDDSNDDHGGHSGGDRGGSGHGGGDDDGDDD